MSTVVTERYGLKVGTPALTSAGALAFGPAGILFVADYAAATVFAIDVADDAVPSHAPVDVADVDARIGSLLGVGRDQVKIRGLAVHPESRAVYLSVTRGHGDAAVPVIVRLAGGEPSEVALEDVPFDSVTIDDAPADDDERQDGWQSSAPEAGTEERVYNGVTLHIARVPLRHSTITDLAWIDGTLLVAGASNEEFVSTLRCIPFPFGDAVRSTGLEIFHVSHGKWETHSPIRSFIPFDSDSSVLASYTCTPVVHFPLAELAPGARATGRTVAELGSMNQPLDMISYRSGGAEYLLVSNSRHPLLRIPAESIAGQEALMEPDDGLPGVPREELPHQGVSLMANLGPDRVLFLQREDEGWALRSHDAASL